MIKRISLSGKMYAGKDYVAKQLNAQILGFADPIYELAESLIGSRDKSIPGVRRTLQELGQWGRNVVNEQYPLSFIRHTVTHRIRETGAYLAPTFRFCNWRKYGTCDSFWTDIFVERFTHLPKLNLFYATTNVRFKIEEQVVRNLGFEHFLVACSEDTRRARMAKTGELYRPETASDISEEYAANAYETFPDHRIVWNDDQPIPAGRKFLSVEEFKSLVTSQQELTL